MTSLLAISLFLPWIDQSIEFGGGVSAFQRGDVLVKVATLMALLVALALIVLIAIGHFETHRPDSAVAVPSLLMTAVDLALALIVYVSLSPTQFTHRGAGAYLGVVGAAIAFVAAITLCAAEGASLRGRNSPTS